MKRRTMSKAGRAALWSQTGGECVYCAQVIPEESRTVDHLVPASLDGRNGAFNLVPACFRCNVRRGAAIPAFRLFHPKWWEWAQNREKASWLRHIRERRPVPEFLLSRIP